MSAARRARRPWLAMTAGALAAMLLLGFGIAELCTPGSAGRSVAAIAQPVQAGFGDVERAATNSWMPSSPTTTARSASSTATPAPPRVRIGAVGIDAAVVETNISAGELQMPLWEVGRVSRGSVTILAGHLYVGNAAGAFGPLHRVTPNMIVEVVEPSGTRAWRVTEVKVHRKGSLPGWIFAGEPGPERLVLITCAGARGELRLPNGTISVEPLDNVVVIAVPL